MKREDLDRLSRLRESANDSARNFRTVYISYLIIALYIFSIVLFMEDELLFRNGSLQIAIVDFSVPIRSFFIISPFILLALHFNLLIQAIFLSHKVRQYASAINDKKMEMCDLLFPAPLAHMIARGGSDRTVQNIFLVTIPIVIMPPAILVVTEIQFLSYQSKNITILQSILGVVDIGILIYLWPRITAPGKKYIQRSQFLSLVNIVLMTLLMMFILVPAGLYDVREFFNQIKPAMSGPHIMGIAKQASSSRLSTTFHGGSDRADTADRKHASSISTWIRDSTLIDVAADWARYDLQDRELVQEKPPSEILSAYLDACGEKRCDEAIIDPGTPVWCKYARPLDLEEHIFSDAILTGAILCAVDFDFAILNNAELERAKLHGANFFAAELRGALLGSAELHGADLTDAELHGADLTDAELHGADLTGAELHGADLTGAELHGADLTGAELHGADLTDAELHGANLTDAELHGADLRNIDLRGAVLRKVKFYGADLTNADLRGADLRGAKFYGVELVGANFGHADLRSIDFSEPYLSELYMQLRKTINNMDILSKIRDRMENAKNHEISIDSLSTKHYYIDDPHDFPHSGSYSGEKSIGDKYREKLLIYLVDDLACKDKSSGYVAERIVRRVLADDLLSRQLAKNLLKAKCPAVADMLPEQLRADLEKITDG